MHSEMDGYVSSLSGSNSMRMRVLYLKKSIERTEISRKNKVITVDFSINLSSRVPLLSSRAESDNLLTIILLKREMSIPARRVKLIIFRCHESCIVFLCLHLRFDAQV